jgi:hypothetical protein
MRNGSQMYLLALTRDDRSIFAAFADPRVTAGITPSNALMIGSVVEHPTPSSARSLFPTLRHVNYGDSPNANRHPYFRANANGCF